MNNWPLMLVEDIPDAVNASNQSELFNPLEVKPFTKEDLTDLFDKISSWGIPQITYWPCPKCVDNIVALYDGKGQCSVCWTIWRERPVLKIVEGKYV